jgi:hypothetical protein
MIEEIFLYITIEDPTIETYVFLPIFSIKINDIFLLSNDVFEQ